MRPSVSLTRLPLLCCTLVSTATLGTSLGTGGMETKIIAAELATGAGVTTVILNSKNISSVFPIAEAGVKSDAEGWTEKDEQTLPQHTRFVPMDRPLNECVYFTLVPEGDSTDLWLPTF